MTRKASLLLWLLTLLPFPCMASDLLAEAEQMHHKAFWELDSGQVDLGHTYIMQAIDLYQQCEGQESRISMCYYRLATTYFNQRDLSAVWGILEKMRGLAEKHAGNIFVQSDYYSVLAAYEEGLMEEQPNDSLRNQMMMHLKRALSYQERMKPQDWTEKFLNPSFNYMNVATMYDMAYDPPVTDSTRLYVAKARAVNQLEWGQPIDHKEADISIRDMEAWLHYYDGEYDKAEQGMLGVVALIDSLLPLKGNAILTEREAAYEFLAMLYEETGRFQEALECQKLMNEVHRQRFDVEKNQALHEVEAKYETEKKEETIRHLNAQNRALLFIIAALAVAALLAVTLWLYYRRLREQRLYTEALQADAEQQAEHTSLTLLADQLGIHNVNLDDALALMRKSEKPLTVVDQKYILCFLAGESVKYIAARFNVEPASVYTVRYRLKRKFPANTELPF